MSSAGRQAARKAILDSSGSIHDGRCPAPARKGVPVGQRRRSRSHHKARNGTHAKPLVQAKIALFPTPWRTIVPLTTQ